MRTIPKKRSVLILEDYDTIRSIIGRNLAQQGYNLISTGSIRDAIPVAREELPQLIIFDVNMTMVEEPMVTLAQLHSILPHTKIIVINGKLPIKEEKFLSTGAFKVIHRSGNTIEFEKIFNDIVQTETHG